MSSNSDCSCGSVRMFQRLAILLLLLSNFLPSWGQIGTIEYTDHLSFDKDMLWTEVSARSSVVAEMKYGFIDSLVLVFAGADNKMQVGAYRFLSDRFEDAFDLTGAIYVSDKILSIANEPSQQRFRLEAHVDLRRFHDALGNFELGRVNSNIGLELAIELNDTETLYDIQYADLENRFNRLPSADLLLEIDSFLINHRTSFVFERHVYFSARLLNSFLEHGLDSITVVRIKEVESKVDRVSDYRYRNGIQVDLCIAKATLASEEGDVDEARKQLQHALAVVEQTNSKWLWVSSIIRLGKFELEEGNERLAIELFQDAEKMAIELDQYDHLVEVSAMSSNLYRKKGDFEKALYYADLNTKYSKQIAETSERFDLESYYLLKEKSALEIQKQNQGLSLSLKDAQVSNLRLFLYLLASLLAILGFVIYSLFRTRRATERRAIRAQNLADEKQRLVEEKSRFFVNISHELRTPVSLILGPLTSLRKDNGMPEYRDRFLDLAIDNANALNLLVNDILDLSKLGAGQMELSNKRIKIHDFFRTELEKWIFSAADRGVSLDYHSFPGGDFELDFDGGKFSHVISNLVSNALKNTPSGGKVSVQLNIDPEALRLIVTDTGEGISKEDLPLIFGRYYQSRKSGALETGGTGIGLSICQEIVQLFKGTISVESIVGSGSTFNVTIPIERLDGKVSTKSESTEPLPGLAHATLSELQDSAGRASILIAEDSPGIREFLKEILSTEYNVKICSNGQSAIEELSAHPTRYSLLITDLMMPELDGFQLVDLVKKNEQLFLLPVLVLTARSLEQDRHKLLRLGVDEYLAKPFVESELLLNIELLLGNSEVRKSEIVNAELEGERPFTEEDYQWLESFEEYVLNNLSDSSLTMGRLATHFAMSDSTLLRRLKILVGLTPKQYVQESRLQNARHQLITKGSSVKAVARDSGYKDARNFSRKFKERFGSNPSEFFGS